MLVRRDGLDVRELRAHHQRAVRALRRERQRRREAEVECRRLRQLVEVVVKWYGEETSTVVVGACAIELVGGEGADTSSYD